MSFLTVLKLQNYKIGHWLLLSMNSLNNISSQLAEHYQPRPDRSMDNLSVSLSLTVILTFNFAQLQIVLILMNFISPNANSRTIHTHQLSVEQMRFNRDAKMLQ